MRLKFTTIGYHGAESWKEFKATLLDATNEDGEISEPECIAALSAAGWGLCRGYRGAKVGGVRKLKYGNGVGSVKFLMRCNDPHVIEFEATESLDF